MLKIAEAILENLTDDEKATLDAGTDEDKVSEIVDKVLNGMGAYSDKFKAKGREDVYRGLDEKVFSDSELADIIGRDRFDKIKTIKGVDKHVQLTNAYKDAIKAIKEAKSDANTPSDARAYADQLKALQAEYEVAKLSHVEALTAKEREVSSKYESEILGERIYNLVQTDGNLADSYKSEKFIRKMVVGEMLEKAAEKGVVINPKTLKVTKEDGTPLFVKGGAEYEIKDLMSEVVVEDWKKKAEATGTGNITVPSSPSGYAKIDPIKAANSKSMLS